MTYSAFVYCNILFTVILFTELFTLFKIYHHNLIDKYCPFDVNELEGGRGVTLDIILLLLLLPTIYYGD